MRTVFKTETLKLETDLTELYKKFESKANLKECKLA